MRTGRHRYLPFDVGSTCGGVFLFTIDGPQKTYKYIYIYVYIYIFMYTLIIMTYNNNKNNDNIHSKYPQVPRFTYMKTPYRIHVGVYNIYH